jgi:hypothetical protein
MKILFKGENHPENYIEQKNVDGAVEVAVC